ncbi:hypothetical protein ACWGBV_32070 [Streptomyces sp. NPDC055051]
MSIAVRVLNRGKELQGVFEDDEERSLFTYCCLAPDTTVRWGVNEYLETIFNSKQAFQLLREMEQLPEEDFTPVLRQLRSAARYAYHRSGYLYFIGD